MRNKKICNLALSYGRIAKIAAQFSHGLVNSAMGEIPCSTERISSCYKNLHLTLRVSEVRLGVQLECGSLALHVICCSSSACRTISC